MRRFVYLWAPPIIWAIIIFTFSANPTGKASQIYWEDFVVKKLAHLVEYAIFATFLFRALKAYMPKRHAVIIAIVTASIYGFTDELHQSFTPGREPRVRDAIIDTIGGVLGIWMIINITPRLPKKLKKLAVKLDLL